MWGAFAAIGLAALVAFLVLYRHVWRMTRRTLARRGNLTRDEFVAQLRREVRVETAEFLWDKMAFLLPTVAPHPDDHLWNDLPLDRSEPMEDWLADYARRHGARGTDWPAWPAGSPHTVRCYARWLESGVASRMA